MRTEYDDDQDEQSAIHISDEACTLVDRIAAALFRHDSSRARILAQGFEDECRTKGRHAALEQWNKYEDEENRREAHYGHGQVMFRTPDGFEFKAEFPMVVLYGIDDWPFIYKTACRSVNEGEVVTAETLKATMDKPIKTRTYERTSRSKRGLPVYEEIEGD